MYSPQNNIIKNENCAILYFLLPKEKISAFVDTQLINVYISLMQTMCSIVDNGHAKH